jgi:hypothetical protein
MTGRQEYLIPNISQHDYDPFRRLISTDLPNTCTGWLRLMKRARLENESRKITVRMIEIHFQEFARYCWAKRCAYNIRALETFTIEKAAGNNINSPAKPPALPERIEAVLQLLE